MRLELKGHQKFWQMRSNLNPDCVRAVKQWRKENGKAVARAIQSNDAKKAVKLMEDGRAYREMWKEIINNRNYIIYAPNGDMYSVIAKEDKNEVRKLE